MLEDLAVLPSHAEAPELYTDWHDPRKYSTGDMGIGECAGEVVSPLEFALTASEREAFKAQLALESGDAPKAARIAYESMIHAATALLVWRKVFFISTNDGIVEAFRKEFHDTQIFFDPFAGGKFAHYFFRAHERAAESRSEESVHRLIEETQLFLEACQSCYLRLSMQMSSVK